MIQPIPQPDIIPLFLIGFGALIAGFAYGLQVKNNIGFASIISGAVTMVVILVVFINPIMDEYKLQVQTLIETTPCNEMAELAHHYQTRIDRIVNEVVLRCLMDNPELAVFVAEHKG